MATSSKANVRSVSPKQRKVKRLSKARFSAEAPSELPKYTSSTDEVEQLREQVRQYEREIMRLRALLPSQPTLASSKPPDPSPLDTASFRQQVEFFEGVPETPTSVCNTTYVKAMLQWNDDLMAKLREQSIEVSELQCQLRSKDRAEGKVTVMESPEVTKATEERSPTEDSALQEPPRRPRGATTSPATRPRKSPPQAPGKSPPNSSGRSKTPPNNSAKKRDTKISPKKDPAPCRTSLTPTAPIRKTAILRARSSVTCTHPPVDACSSIPFELLVVLSKVLRHGDNPSSHQLLVKQLRTVITQLNITPDELSKATARGGSRSQNSPQKGSATSSGVKEAFHRTRTTPVKLS